MNTERMTNRIEIEDDEPASPPAAPSPKPAPKQVAPEPKAEKADGTEFVEITDDALKARFNHLYRTTKEAQERAARTERGMKALLEQNQKLFAAVQSLSDKQRDKETQAELSSLRQEAETALATGDTKTFTQVNERLSEIKAEQIVAQQAPPQQEPEPQQQAAVTNAEIAALQKWQQSKDEDGQFIRPWAIPGHEEFEAAQDMLRRISASEQFREAPIREILAEVDRRMSRVLGVSEPGEEAANPVRRAFAAPQGRPAAARNPSRDTLSAEERKIAENMFIGGRGAPAKNAKEAHDLYLAQKKALTRVVAVED